MSNYTDEQIEIAARRLCELWGKDPDETSFIPSPIEDARAEIKKQIKIEESLQYMRKADEGWSHI